MIQPDLELARDLFDTLRRDSFDGVGVTRDTYGAGEQRAHDTVAATARSLGMEIHTDAALNLYMTLPGRDRKAAVRITGSHLDSVPRGGNFDGAAGVVAGLAVVAGWRRRDHVPATDVTVMAIRAEESAWFPVSYIGSKAAFGQLPAAALQARRRDNGATLNEAITAAGGDVSRLRDAMPHLDAARIGRFVELHIEQGPVLIDADQQVGIVTGICGSVRYREVRCLGTYAHSGATPRSHRHDAVVAMSAFVLALHAAWVDLEAQGHELTVTHGCFSTDPLQADFSKVAGRVDLCIDIRSRSAATLAAMTERVGQVVAEIETRYQVQIALGPKTGSDAGQMDPALRAELVRNAARMGLKHCEMPSGAGHDAAVFAGMGVPSAMIFVRNAHGSHNPDEAMAQNDFAEATRLLSSVLDGPV